MNEFGFTNNKDDYDQVVAFRQAMVDDGWTTQLLYPGHESMETASRLRKDDWVAQVIARQRTGNWLYEAAVHIWGPDALAIAVPAVYSMSALTKALRVCGYCGKADVHTRRIAFAGRCCAECHSELLPKLEYPGWAN